MQRGIERERVRERGGRERSRREKDELRRFRRRIKRKGNKLAEERIGNVGRWSAGKKEEGPKRKKSLWHAYKSRPDSSIGTILLIPTKVCDDSAFRDDLTPRNVDTWSVWHVSPCMLPKFSSNVTPWSYEK